MNDDKVTLRRKRIVAASSIIIAIGIMLWLGWLITETVLKSINSEQGISSAARNFKEMIEGYGNTGVIIAFLIQVLQVVVSPIPGQVIEVGMGICYGWFWGAVICLLGGAVGAAIIMAIVKKWGIKVVELFISTEKLNQWKFLNNPKKLEWIIFLIYVMPGTPKDPFIFFFGLTKIKTKKFVIIQTLARVPAIISTTVAGQFAAEEKFVVTIIIFVITAIMAVLGLWFYNNILLKKENKKNITKIEEQDV